MRDSICQKDTVKIICTLFCLLFFNFECKSPSNKAGEEIAMFRVNLKHTGEYKTKPLHQFKEVKWIFRTGGPIRSTPAVIGGTAYFGSGDKYFYAIDIHTGKEKWKFKTGGAVHSSPVVADGKVYFTSRDRYLYALDTQSGKQRWKIQTGETLPYQWGFDYYLSSPIVAKGIIYFGSGDGCLYALNTNSGQLKWKFNTGARVRSSPAMADGVIYVGNMDGSLFAIDSKTGEQKWKFDTEGASINPANFGFDRTAILSSPAIAAGLVVFGSRDGYLYAVDIKTGQQKWRFNHKVSWVISSPAIVEGVVFTGSSDGHFFQAVDLSTGKEKWRFKTKSAVWSSPAVADGLVYFGDFAGNLYALDAGSGQEKWRFKTNGMIISSPVVQEGNVYFGSDDGYLYALTGTKSDKPSPIKAKKAVFWEATAGFKWFGLGVDERIRDFFREEGYELLDAEKLARFMKDRTEDYIPSVIVFASNRLPETIISEEAEISLFRQYLNAGGKAVWLGLCPLAFKRDPKTGKISKLDFSIPERILGIRYPGYNLDGFGGWYGANVTSEGVKWGLRGWWVGCGSVDVEEVTTVLALDENGRAAAWVKNYGGPEGSGLVQVWVNRETCGDLTPIKAVAEYGLSHIIRPKKRH